jgi:hypothetical protein
MGAPARASDERSGVLLGAYAQPRHGQTLQEAAESLERALGVTLPIIRSYGRFDSPIDSAINHWAVSGDRTVLTSISTRRRDGSRVRWRQIAEARPGSRVHDEMVALARSANRLDGELWVIFSHEPEAAFNHDLGSNTDFIAAWRALHSVFELEGAGSVRWVWTMTSWSYEVGRFDPSDPRRAERWYPGDEYVDLLGADPYNWNGCRGNDRETWESLEETTRPFLEWSRRHPDKGLVLPEFGSVEGGSGAKAAWLREIGALMQRPEWSDRFEAIVYFHDDHSDTEGGTDCRWWLDSSPATLEAARALASDPHFTGKGRAVPECSGLRATLVGTDGDDLLIGTPGRDVIVGLGGRDRIEGRGGDDVICGGPGSDVLIGGDGRDRILGQDGRDILRGGAGADALLGGRHRDRLSGGSGPDIAVGGSGGDVVAGGAGTDRLDGGNGNDRVLGNGGDDAVAGGAGRDFCSGWDDRGGPDASCESGN